MPRYPILNIIAGSSSLHVPSSNVEPRSESAQRVHEAETRATPGRLLGSPPRSLEHALALCPLNLRTKLLTLTDEALMPLVVADDSVLGNGRPESLEE